MSADTNWVRQQLGTWHEQLAQSAGDLAPFWRRIWRLQWGGRQYCVKLPRPTGESGAEGDLLRALHAAGYPVPRLHWQDKASGLLVMDWIDGASLENLLKQPKSDERDAALARCVQGLAHLERAAELVADIAPTPEPPTPNARDFAADLVRLAKQLAADIDDARLPSPCAEVAGAICADPRPTLGIVDILPRDVILGKARPVFLDFWPVGWWWAEKRFCQYFARFQQDARDRARQSEWFLQHFPLSNAARLDAHHLWHDIAWLNAWQEIRDSSEESGAQRDALDRAVNEALDAGRKRLTWHGACAGANELRSMLCDRLSG